MQELVGRLTALDPEATESLKVIAYFDALIDGHASSEVLLRGAAVLSGCAAGYISNGSSGRVDASGHLAPAGAAEHWPSHATADGGRAWLERTGEPHANDAMVLERLSIALGILLERSAPIAAARKAVETLLDPTETREAHAAAAARLRLDVAAKYRVVAEPAGSPVATSTHSTVVITPVGPVRASIRPAGEPVDSLRAGVGVTSGMTGLDHSWTSALVALRLTGDHAPVLCADDLGTLIMLAEAADAAPAESSDLAAIRKVVAESGHALAVLESIVATDSVRAAAADAGLHHSTMQVKAAELSKALGFDIRTVEGRTRLSLALSLYRLASNSFE